MAFPRSAPKGLLLECPASESGFQGPRASLKSSWHLLQGRWGLQPVGGTKGGSRGTSTQKSSKEGPGRREDPHQGDTCMDRWTILIVIRVPLTLTLCPQLMLTVKQSREPLVPEPSVPEPFQDIKEERQSAFL